MESPASSPLTSKDLEPQPSPHILAVKNFVDYRQSQETIQATAIATKKPLDSSFQTVDLQRRTSSTALEIIASECNQLDASTNTYTYPPRTPSHVSQERLSLLFQYVQDTLVPRLKITKTQAFLDAIFSFQGNDIISTLHGIKAELRDAVIKEITQVSEDITTKRHQIQTQRDTLNLQIITAKEAVTAKFKTGVEKFGEKFSHLTSAYDSLITSAPKLADEKSELTPSNSSKTVTLYRGVVTPGKREICPTLFKSGLTDEELTFLQEELVKKASQLDLVQMHFKHTNREKTAQNSTWPDPFVSTSLSPDQASLFGANVIIQIEVPEKYVVRWYDYNQSRQSDLSSVQAGLEDWNDGSSSHAAAINQTIDEKSRLLRNAGDQEYSILGWIRPEWIKATYSAQKTQ